MMSRKHPMLLFTALSMTAFVASAAHAQNAQPGGSPATRTDQSAGRQGNDHLLASCVAIDNQEEIAIAEFAQEKSKNDDVKEFAKMLVSDHHEFLKKLHQYAPEATQDNFLRSERTEASNRVVPAQGSTRQQPGNQSQTRIEQTSGQRGMQLDLMTLHKELAEQCLADAKAKLNDEDKDRFDKCFVGMQIAKHAAMKSKLEVFERHASGELKNVFAAGLKTTSSHLEHAEKLMQQLDDGSDDKRDRKDRKDKNDDK